MLSLDPAGPKSARALLPAGAQTSSAVQDPPQNADILETPVEVETPTSLTALQSTGACVTCISGPESTCFADVTVAVPNETLRGGSWSAVKAWTAYSVNRAFLSHASPLLRRTLEDRAKRGDDASLLLEWAPCAAAKPAGALLSALYGTPLRPTFDDAVELRALLAYWWAPITCPWELRAFLPAWPGVLRDCEAVIAAHIAPETCAQLYDRARQCGDAETEYEVVAWASRDVHAKPWLLSLDCETLHQVIDHPAFTMAASRRVRTLLAWSTSPHHVAEAQGTREKLRRAMRWDALSDADARKLGLPALVRAVDLGLLEPAQGFGVLRRLGHADLSTPAPAALPAAAAAVPAPPPVRPWKRRRKKSRPIYEGAGWIALNAVGNAVTASAAVLEGAYRGQWQLAHSAPLAFWMGALYGVVEGAAVLWYVESKYLLGCDRFRDAMGGHAVASPALGGLFGVGTAAGFGLATVARWPFVAGLAPGPTLGIPTTVGASLGGILGVLCKGLALRESIFEL